MSDQARPRVEVAVLVADLIKIRTSGSKALDSCPSLKEALRLPVDLPTEEAWAQVEQHLRFHAAQLDSRRRIAFLEGLGLRPQAPRSRSERLALVAARIDRSERAARRDEALAIEQIAGLIASSQANPVMPIPEWLVTKARFHMDLRGDAPSIILERTIQSLVGVGDKFVDFVRFPGLLESEKISVTSTIGCEVESVEFKGAGYFVITSRLAKPVMYGDEHEFGISASVPRHDAMDTCVCYYPRTPTRAVRLEVTFGTKKPGIVERFDAEMPSKIFPEEVEQLDPNQRHHVCDFTRLVVGGNYGIRWEWADELTNP